MLDQFYTQLGKIKDYHRKYPNETVEDLASLYENGLAKAKHQQKLLEDSLMSGTTTEEEVAEIQATLGNKKGANILLSAAATDLDLDSIFSGEEFYGKYLDLIEFHDKFLNLKFLPPKEQSLSFYLKYLDNKSMTLAMRRCIHLRLDYVMPIILNTFPAFIDISANFSSRPIRSRMAN